MYRLYWHNVWCPIQFSSVRSVLDKIAEWTDRDVSAIELEYNPAGDGILDVFAMPKLDKTIRDGYILLPSGRHF
jgi:hypothetical protein